MCVSVYVYVYVLHTFTSCHQHLNSIYILGEKVNINLNVFTSHAESKDALHGSLFCRENIQKHVAVSAKCPCGFPHIGRTDPALGESGCLCHPLCGCSVADAAESSSICC